MNITDISLGNDPELMLFDKKSKEIISAIPLIPEGKEKHIHGGPRNLGDGYAVLHDNVLLEFNVPPSFTEEGFVETLREGFKRIYKVIGKNYDLVPQASHYFAEKYLQHDEAKLFGCSPEMCAYAIEVCNPPECAGTFRSCGSHVHIGRKDFKNFLLKDSKGKLVQDDNGNYCPIDEIDEGEVLIDPYSKLNIIKLMDIYVGLILTLIDTSKASKERKKLYGVSGRHRPTHFGVEYRTPSNYWTSSPKLTKLIHQLTLLAVKQEIENETANVLNRFKENIVRATIDKGHEIKARELIKRIDLPNNIKSVLNYFSSNTVSPFELRKNWGI
jgi:hypothetical protein